MVLFWHTYLDYDFKLVVQEQLMKLFTSNLYGKADIIKVGISSSSQENTEWFLRLLNSYSKFEPIINRDGDAEKTTLRLLYNYCQSRSDDFPLLYFHTKAVTNSGYNKTLWRWSMDYNLLYRWKECLTALESADAVGINYRQNTHLGHFPHFSGNYWWTKASYVRTLKEWYLYNKEYLLDLHPKANLLLAEFFIGSNPDGVLKSVFECRDEAPYSTECLISEYIKESQQL